MKAARSQRKRAIGMKRHLWMLPLVLAAFVALILAASAPQLWAGGWGYYWDRWDRWDNGEEDEMPFDVADVYAELNDTDGDLGFHALIDGEAWKKLEIEDPRGRKLLDVYAIGRLRQQGLTELFFESAEPPFDKLSPEEFFKRFPEGEYEIEGKTLAGGELESTDLFWHVMPAQPGLQEEDGSVMIIVGGEEDVVIKGKCDDEDPAYDPVEVSGDTGVTIDWDPVTTSHPTIGEEYGGDGDLPLVRYQVVVEDEESGAKFTVDLPPEITSITVPAWFTDSGEEFKYEILVKEVTGGNQTAVESCFTIAE